MYGPLKLMEDVSQQLTFSAGEGSSSHVQQLSSCFKCSISVSLVGHSEAFEELQGETEQNLFLPDNNQSFIHSEEFVIIICLANVGCETHYHVDMLSKCCTLHMDVFSLCMRVRLVANWITKIRHDLHVTKYNQATTNFGTPKMETNGSNCRIMQSHLDVRQDFAFAWRRN